MSKVQNRSTVALVGAIEAAGGGGDVSLPRGDPDGLLLQVWAPVVGTLRVSPGTARNRGNTITGTNASYMVKRIKSPWAAGDDEGGYAAAGAIVDETWYRFFAIFHDVTNALDFGWDDDPDAVNLLSAAGASYTTVSQIGWSFYDASIRRFIHRADRPDYIQWHQPTRDFSVQPPTTRTSYEVSAPPDSVADIITTMYGSRANITADVFGIVSDIVLGAVTPSANLNNEHHPGAGTTDTLANSHSHTVGVDSSSEIGLEYDQTHADLTVNGAAVGYYFKRG